jgi:hypothetical protein
MRQPERHYGHVPSPVRLNARRRVLGTARLKLDRIPPGALLLPVHRDRIGR